MTAEGSAKNHRFSECAKWRVVTDKAEDGSPYIEVVGEFDDGTENVVCRMGVSDGDAWGGYVGEDKDAVLISAARELYAACEAALIDLADYPGDRTSEFPSAATVRAALKKARGAA